MSAADLQQGPTDAIPGTVAAPAAPVAHESLAASLALNERLILWGQVYLQGATGEELGEDREREPTPKPQWTRWQEDAAWAIDRRVNALAPKLRIILRVFYRAWQAECWDEFAPDKQLEIEGQLCREVNARWRAYCAEIGELPRTVRAYQLQALREAAILELVGTKHAAHFGNTTFRLANPL